jgi:endoglucanase
MARIRYSLLRLASALFACAALTAVLPAAASANLLGQLSSDIPLDPDEPFHAPRLPVLDHVLDPRGVDPASANPLAGIDNWFVDREWEPKWQQYLDYLYSGQNAKAEAMFKIAREPQFKWFGRWNERPGYEIRKYLVRVAEQQPGSVPSIAVMRHQGKGCKGGYTGGDAAEDARHRRWIDGFARGIGNARVVIAYEPDSLGTLDCLVGQRRRARLDNLRYGVDVLSKLPNATIYLEAGASDWEPARRTARQLRYIGIDKVRGFMLNVTHYDWTRNNIKHGLKISRRVGGKPFVISTSFNGRGPVHYRRWINRRKHLWKTVNVWCHPLKRGLGPRPTTATHHPKVDAYLYVGRPGYSGGRCNGGPLPVGRWWPHRARMFAKYATNWIRPPRGTRYGHRRRYPLVAVAGDQLGR